MSATDMTPREALLRFGASTAEAIAQVLEMFAPGAVERGDVSVMGEDQSPFSGIVAGSVAASVSYVDGVTGANIFVLTAAGVRSMAQAMGMPAPEEGEPDELSELELSAVGEASNQMMAAAASAIGVVLGQEIAISPPDIQVIDNPDALAERYGSSPHATSTTFLIGGESCRLIQLVPRAFVVRMARALDELDSEVDGDLSGGDGDDGGGAQSTALVEALTGIKLRVWAELGRSQLGLSRALGLPLGAVVELDRDAEEPIDLYVNGLRFAQGHLIVTDDGEWAFQCDVVGGRAIPDGGFTETPEVAIPAEVADELYQAASAESAAQLAQMPGDTEEIADPAEAEVAPENIEEIADAAEPEIPAHAAEADQTTDAASADTPAAPQTPNEEGAVE
jgi:flagellar motor switch protein FliN/FliY